MKALRSFGLKISIVAMNAAQFARYCVRRLQGIKATQGVRILIIDNSENVLLVRHWYAPWAWCLPGGGIEIGESPYDAAIREASEETAITVGKIDGDVGRYTGKLNDTVYVVYTNSYIEAHVFRPNIEIMARAWFPLQSLPKNLAPRHAEYISVFSRNLQI